MLRGGERTVFSIYTGRSRSFKTLVCVCVQSLSVYTLYTLFRPYSGVHKSVYRVKGKAARGCQNRATRQNDSIGLGSYRFASFHFLAKQTNCAINGV